MPDPKYLIDREDPFLLSIARRAALLYASGYTERTALDAAIMCVARDEMSIEQMERLSSGSSRDACERILARLIDEGFPTIPRPAIPGTNLTREEVRNALDYVARMHGGPTAAALAALSTRLGGPAAGVSHLAAALSGRRPADAVELDDANELSRVLSEGAVADDDADCLFTDILLEKPGFGATPERVLRAAVDDDRLWAVLLKAREIRVAARDGEAT
jgi:hypothetical protein